MNQELPQRVHGFDGDLASARQFEVSFANVFDPSTAERLELPAHAASLSLAEANEKLRPQTDSPPLPTEPPAPHPQHPPAPGG